jgi:hypothetical protein
MSALPNPLTNVTNALVWPQPGGLVARSQRIDPQLGILFDQKIQETRSFQFHVLEKRVAQGFQQVPCIDPANGLMETEHVQVGPAESPEMRWLVKNRLVLEAYHGEWLLILNDTLVIHSAEFTEIRRAIADRNIRSPFVYYVPTEEESNFIAS